MIGGMRKHPGDRTCGGIGCRVSQLFARGAVRCAGGQSSFNMKGENKMSMDKKSTEFGSWTLSEIIEGRYFRVPDYQRGYAWGERQVAEFWEDLCAIVAAGARHYTGAITVEALDGASEITPRKGFAVVDGQQRLTTVAILFSALKLESNPLLVKAEGGDNYVFSYGANNDDQQFLRRILSGNVTGSPKTAISGISEMRWGSSCPRLNALMRIRGGKSPVP